MKDRNKSCLLLCLIFCAALPFVTLLYAVKWRAPVLWVALAVNVVAFLVSLVCFILNGRGEKND